MKRALYPLALIPVLLIPLMARGESVVSQDLATSVVFIANYGSDNVFRGWGSGFFVDEGIVVTNKHVIEAGDWYRVYATGADQSVDLNCYVKITKSDVKINLDDDVAYMRAYPPCAHGIMDFGSDPEAGDHIQVMGFPFKGSTAASIRLTVVSGSVLPGARDDWLRTDALLDRGNSGGPVIDETGVAGVAVAKGVDAEGNYVSGYFIPSSVILRGLLYANDSQFGYTVRSRSSLSISSSSSSRSSSSSSKKSLSSLRSSASSVSSVAKPLPSFRIRTCERVMRWFLHDEKILMRVNERLTRRFGFACS